MATDKQSMLYHAPAMLNRPDIPWVVSVEGDTIIARWKWMDALWFAMHEVTDQVKSYYFSVTLTDKGTYKEVDYTESTAKNITMNDGKIGFGTSTEVFKGKKNQKSFEMGLGKDNATGKFGVIGFKYNTTQVKDQLRSYLDTNGWKKAGLFK